MRTRLMLISILVLGAASATARGDGQSGEPVFTADFGLSARQNLLPGGANRYFPLQPGTFHRYEGVDEGDFIEVETRVLDQVRPVLFRVDNQWAMAITRVVEEREWVNGELVQIALNYFACCPRSGNVFFFGEDVDLYEDGQVVGHEGTWLAGENDARPGLYMPGLFLVGSRYCKALAPEVSMDRVENVEAGVTVATPAGVFERSVSVLETSALEEDEEVLLFYAPGVGLIVDETLRLVEFHRPMARAGTIIR